MDTTARQTQVIGIFSAVLLAHFADATSKDPVENSVIKSLVESGADRYAGGFQDSYVADTWEQAADGWVHGGYTLVSGDKRTDVRYAVDPSGEVRVAARRPGPVPGQQAELLPGVPGPPGGTGSPLLGGFRYRLPGYRPGYRPLYERLAHHGRGPGPGPVPVPVPVPVPLAIEFDDSLDDDPFFDSLDWSDPDESEWDSFR